MAQPQPQPPLPNAANINAAINGMAAEGNNLIMTVREHNAHQQALATELSLCTNYNIAQVHLQLGTVQASIAAMQGSITAMQASIAAMQAAMEGRFTAMQASLDESRALNSAQ
jgi:outer membrane usher protein FimD/PapC